jgi:C4-dicarboxylate-binding protein DctP
VVVVNKKFWEGLPADIRASLEKAMAEATAYGNTISKQENDEAWADIKKSGKTEIIELTADQKAALKKAMMPVYQQAEARVGKSLIEEFEAATKGTGTH